MIEIKNLTKKFRKYQVPFTTLKSFAFNFKRHQKLVSQIDWLCPVKNLSLSIKKGEIFCIVGPNGAGKSTLAKLIAGTTMPTSGKILLSGIVVPFLELGVAFSNELSGTDNLYLNGSLLGLSLTYLRKNKKNIFAFANLEGFENTPLKYYSSGMQLRLAFSIAMHANGDIYIFDEILAVGDSSFQKKCMAAFYDIIKKKKTIIIVSHDIEFVKKHATRLLVLANGKHRLIDDPIEIQNLSTMEDLLANAFSPSPDAIEHEKNQEKETA